MHTTKALVSIIIPAFNVEKYLAAALSSIQAQSQAPDEVILIDDGSTDRTKEVAESYHLECPYRVVSIENGGQGNARNLGVSLASSEYVYFFDSDDLLAKNFISCIRQQITGNQYPDIIFFSGDSFNDTDYDGSRWMHYSRGFSGVFDNRADLLDEGFSRQALFCSPCLYVSKRSLWGASGLKFGPNFMEDEAIFFPLLFACRSFAVIDQVFFLRRNRHGSTMTMVFNAKHLNGALHCMQTTLGLHSSVDLTSRERWHIRKRLEAHCISYIKAARKSGLSVCLTEVLRAIFATKSLELAVKAFVYGVGADRLEIVKRIVRTVKKQSRGA